MSLHVVCPAKLTSPHPDPHALALGLTPNMPCNERVAIVRVGAAMDCRCARGHRFIATPADLRSGGTATTGPDSPAADAR